MPPSKGTKERAPGQAWGPNAKCGQVVKLLPCQLTCNLHGGCPQTALHELGRLVPTLQDVRFHPARQLQGGRLVLHASAFQ